MLARVLAFLAASKAKIIAFAVGAGALVFGALIWRSRVRVQAKKDARIEQLEEHDQRAEDAHDIETRAAAKDGARAAAAAVEKQKIIDRTEDAVDDAPSDEDADRLLGEAKKRWADTKN